MKIEWGVLLVSTSVIALFLGRGRASLEGEGVHMFLVGFNFR